MINRKHPPSSLKTWEILFKTSICSEYSDFDFLFFAREGCSPVKEKLSSGLVIITAKLDYGKFPFSSPELTVQRERKRFLTLIFHLVF